MLLSLLFSFSASSAILVNFVISDVSRLEAAIEIFSIAVLMTDVMRFSVIML